MKKSLGFWSLLGCSAMCAAVVTTDANAGWANAVPTADRVVVTVRGNIVTNVQATKNGATVGGIRGVGRKIIADIPFTCSGGSTLFRYAARSIDSAEPPVVGTEGGASLSVPVVLGTGAEFAALCAGTNAGTKDFRILTVAGCYKQNAMPPFSFYEKLHSMQVIVTCDPNYRVPTQSTPIRYRHTCPAGFGVGNTGQQTAETNSANSLCVKNGMASGPQG
jgi:hypothetical protein